ncbi:Centromere C-like protein [Quillaja saponaria]|uniref:Centromere C-like protein n=1 Tax=Quillaja saponaria TaxID=32244 RepID=A0AAD7L5X9_QUISA|nr:Centromere C-like protein [Quillaja saponaria]
MVNEAQISNLLDPLADYWGLSLFPQTSGVYTNPSKPYNPADDIDATHNHLRSMALRSPNKLMEQAKSIRDGNPELFNSKIPDHMASNEKNQDGAEKAKENPRERRPALGRKRARFSLNPNISQPNEILEPILDIDKLKDPEEFFKEFERIENAKREIQKQLGGNSSQNDIATNTRQRRPGILGNNQRRSVKYKHLYPSIDSNNNEHAFSSQESFESGSIRSGNQSLQETEADAASQQMQSAGSSAVEDEKLKGILDGLLHSNYEDLEGDGAIGLLQESLQIKPIVLKKLSFPKFPDNQMIGLKSFGGNLSKPRKALSEIDNLLKEMNNKTPMKLGQDAESNMQHLASPTPPKSPFAAFSLLQKRILQSKPLTDQFSAIDSDHLSARNSSPTDKMNFESGFADSGERPLRFSDEMKSLLSEDAAVSKQSTLEMAIGVFDTTSEKVVEDNSSKADIGINEGSKESNVGMEDNTEGCDMDNMIAGDMISYKGNDQANGLCEIENKAEDAHEVVPSAQPDDPEPNLVEPVDQSSVARMEAGPVDGSTVAPYYGSEQHMEEMADRSELSTDKQRKGKLRPRRERWSKELTRRQSLAGAGTSWTGEVRRSTRIKFRPLEYWRGERPVYGRIHQTMATIIGVKLMSPAKDDGKPTLKVKSYVSDEYNEVLELAALH